MLKSVRQNEKHLMIGWLIMHILSTIPDFSGEAYIVINDNVPFFTEEEKECKFIWIYSDLDELGVVV